METKKVLLWWFLYNIVGTLAGAGVGLVGGFFGGFFAAILGLPEGFEVVMMILIVIGALICNFFVFKWAVRKIIEY
ncbi:MAG: hypothetical protein ACFFKA_08460 [Candidatus Thorarchaeota archaeon]|jgi:hypothetical protein